MDPNLDPDVEAEGVSMPSDPKTFPPTYASNRPRYDADRPVTILDYIKGCEEVIGACKVTDERIKKRILTHYLDLTTQASWKGLSKWKTGTYAEFKAEVLSYHPAALREQRGGIIQLLAVCDQYRPVNLSQHNELLQFLMKFRAEARKVEQGDVGNREIVNAFMGALGETLRDKIWERLAFEGSVDERGEMKIKYDKLIELAENIARTRTFFHERFGEQSQNQGRALYQPDLLGQQRGRQGEAWDAEVREAERAIAKMRESAAPSKMAVPPPVQIKREFDIEAFTQKVETMIDKKLQAHTDSLQGIVEDVKMTKDRLDILSRNPHNFSVSTQSRPPRAPNPYNQSGNQGCFYCLEPGHYAGSCLHKAKHVSEGRIKDDPSGTYFPNGQRLMNRHGESPKEAVERMTQAKAAQNLQSYDDWEPVSQYQLGVGHETEQWATREDIKRLTSMVAQLAVASPHNNSRPPNPAPPPRVERNESQSWDGMQQLLVEQQRTNRMMEQFLANATSSQYVATRSSPQEDAEDFH